MYLQLPVGLYYAHLNELLVGFRHPSISEHANRKISES